MSKVKQQKLEQSETGIFYRTVSWHTGVKEMSVLNTFSLLLFSCLNTYLFIYLSPVYLSVIYLIQWQRKELKILEIWYLQVKQISLHVFREAGVASSYLQYEATNQPHLRTMICLTMVLSTLSLRSFNTYVK